MQNRFDTEDLKFTVAVVICSWACFSGILFVPLWVAASTEYLGISDAFAGRLAAVQHAAVALASFGLMKLVRALPSGTLFASGIMMILAANTLPLLAPSVELFAACRFLSGAGEGVSLAVMHSLIARRGRPDRYFALMNFGVTIFAIVAYPAVSPLIADYSVFPVFGIAALSALIGLPFAIWMSRHAGGPVTADGGDDAMPQMGAIRHNRDGLIGLLALIIFFVGEGALWTYFTRIGLSKDMTFAEVGRVMSISLFFGLVATVIVRVLDVRIGRTIPLVVSILGLCCVAMLFAYAESRYMFMVAAYLMYFVFLFTVTYSSGLLAHTDSSGSIAAAAPGARSIGNVLGPIIASFSVGLGNFVSLGWTAFAFYLMSLVLFLSISVKYDRRLKDPAA